MSQDDVDLGQRIATFLGEFRIVVPALAVLFGFQLQAAFSPAWSDLAFELRLVNYGALVATALGILFLLTPASYHRLTTGLDESEWFLHFAQRIVSVGFAFTTISITLSLYLQAVRTFEDAAWSLVATFGFFALFLLAWWVVPHWLAHRRGIHHGWNRPRR